MERKEFLSHVGLGAASMLFLNCLVSCTKATDTPVAAAPSNLDFTLDLSSSTNAALTKAGGYVFANGIIVAHSTNGGYIAVSRNCPHQGTSVVFQPNDTFYCPNHGAVFSASGGVVSGPVSRPLTQYKTAVAQ